MLENAGVEGFLSNVHDFRDESAVDRKAWQQHLADLTASTGQRRSSGDDVRKERHQRRVHRPAGTGTRGCRDPAKERRKYNWHLGEPGIAARGDVWADRRVLRRRDGMGHSGRVKWYVELSGDSGVSLVRHQDKTRIARECHFGTCAFARIGARGCLTHPPDSTIPSSSTSRQVASTYLWRTGPEYARVVGRGPSPVTVDTDMASVVGHPGPLVAHNGFQFDFHVLTRHGLSWDRDLIDTKVLAALHDPPPLRHEARPDRAALLAQPGGRAHGADRQDRRHQAPGPRSTTTAQAATPSR